MDYHCIESEKANAMMRYRRLRNVAKMWRLIEVLVALVLISWSSTRLPAAGKLAGNCFMQISLYLFNPHINFVIGNAIIILIVFLSRQNNSFNTSSSVSTSASVDGQQVENSESHHEMIASLSETPPPQKAETAAAEAYEEKRIVISENAVSETQCDEASLAIEKAAKQLRRFERTESEKLRRDLCCCRQLRRSETEIKEKVTRQLRRSETVIERRVVDASSGEERTVLSIDRVDTLSNEEFRHTVETYIAKHQRFLWAQKMQETNH